MIRQFSLRYCSAVVLAVLLSLTTEVFAAEANTSDNVVAAKEATPKVNSNKKEAHVTKQKVFSDPNEAVAELIKANREDSTKKILKILGSEAEPLISSGDPVADHEGRQKFLAAYDEAHKLTDQGDDRKILLVGKKDWPMPIPLVLGKDGWKFDSEMGSLEILNRRIGRNELNVVNVCRSFVDAEHDFADQHPLDGDEKEYASKFISSPGEHDGLYWPTEKDEQLSPLGPLIAAAAEEGYSDLSEIKERYAYHGYFYKILKGQGAYAHGGTMDYMKDGHMSEGFALVAYPARYGNSGIMTFIVNAYGIVYEKNLGPDTATIAAKMDTYDPDDSWHIQH